MGDHDHETLQETPDRIPQDRSCTRGRVVSAHQTWILQRYDFLRPYGPRPHVSGARGGWGVDGGGGLKSQRYVHDAEQIEVYMNEYELN